jgi:long-chain acyl-CoA synthetase
MTKKTAFQKINPNQSIYQAWREQNLEKNNRGNLCACEYFENRMTFAEIDTSINNYARSFKQLRRNSDSSVTFCAPTLPSTMIAFYALNKLGVRTNFVSAEILQSNGPEYLDKTDSETLVLFDGFYEKIAGEIGKTGVKNILLVSLADNITDIPNQTPERLKHILDPDFRNQNFNKIKSVGSSIHKRKEYLNLDEFVSAAKNNADEIVARFTPEDTAVILYSGGSTGIPKGVEKRNEEFNHMLAFYPEVLHMDNLENIRNGIFIPPNHPTSLVHSIIEPWAMGATNVLQPIYDKNTFPDDIYRLGINYAVAAPSHYAMFQKCNLPDGALKKFHVPMTGGESVSRELAETVNKVFKKLGCPSPLIVGYGMSEMGPTNIFTVGEKGLGNKPGKPVPSVKARIIDDNGKELGANQRGGLEIFAPYVRMKGYYQNPKLTQEFFTEDGWGKTGDVAVRDEDGNYEIFGRESDHFIDANGEKHYLFDIENVTYHHPAIAEAEATKLITFEGEIPVSTVVLKDEYQGREEDILNELYELYEENLSPAEIPHGVRFIESFATNPVSTKRDYKILQKIRIGYYAIDNGQTCKVTFFNEKFAEKSPKSPAEKIEMHRQ